MYITGFKKLSAIVAAIITIVYGFINLIVIWKMADTKYTMHLLSAIGGTAMVFYISYGFIAGCISKVEEENEKKKLATFIKIIDKECHN